MGGKKVVRFDSDWMDVGTIRSGLGAVNAFTVIQSSDTDSGSNQRIMAAWNGTGNDWTLPNWHMSRPLLNSGNPTAFSPRLETLLANSGRNISNFVLAKSGSGGGKTSSVGKTADSSPSTANRRRRDAFSPSRRSDKRTLSTQHSTARLNFQRHQALQLKLREVAERRKRRQPSIRQCLLCKCNRHQLKALTNIRSVCANLSELRIRYFGGWVAPLLHGLSEGVYRAGAEMTGNILIFVVLVFIFEIGSVICEILMKRTSISSYYFQNSLYDVNFMFCQ